MTTAQDSPTRPILTEERRQFLIAHGRRIRIDSWDEQLNYRNTLEREALVDPDVPGVFLSREEASSIAEAARKPVCSCTCTSHSGSSSSVEPMLMRNLRPSRAVLVCQPQSSCHGSDISFQPRSRNPLTSQAAQSSPKQLGLMK